MNRGSATRMLCARPAPVKYERNRRKRDRAAEARQPNLQKLRTPVALDRDADAIAAGEIDLGREKGRGKGQQCQGCEDSRAAP